MAQSDTLVITNYWEVNITYERAMACSEAIAEGQGDQRVIYAGTVQYKIQFEYANESDILWRKS